MLRPPRRCTGLASPPVGALARAVAAVLVLLLPAGCGAEEPRPTLLDEIAALDTEQVEAGIRRNEILDFVDWSEDLAFVRRDAGLDDVERARRIQEIEARIAEHLPHLVGQDAGRLEAELEPLAARRKGARKRLEELGITPRSVPRLREAAAGPERWADVAWLGTTAVEVEAQAAAVQRGEVEGVPEAEREAVAARGRALAAFLRKRIAELSRLPRRAPW